jgi:chromosome segregation ATPase
MSAPSPSRQEPSIRTLLAANRAQQSAVLPQLFSLISSLSAPSSSSASANTSLQISRLYTQLATLDEELAVLTERARKHAEKWERMERLKTECVAVEREVRRRAIKLQKGRRELEQLLSEGKETVKRIDLAAERTFSPDVVFTLPS